MKESFKKGFRMGLGMLYLGKKAAEKAAAKIGKSMRLGTSEVKELAAFMMDEASAARKKVSKVLSKDTKKELARVGMRAKPEGQRLQARLGNVKRKGKAKLRTVKSALKNKVDHGIQQAAHMIAGK